MPVSKEKLRRVVFHSKEDLSFAQYLREAEKLLDSTNVENKLDINDILEYYNIKLYFDNGLFLDEWDKKKQNSYKEIVELVLDKNKVFWFNIGNNSTSSIIKDLEFRYRESFWKLFSYYQVYKRIDKEEFKNILNKFQHHIRYILENKKLVNHYNNEIRSFLLIYENSAELILSRTEKVDIARKSNFNFPKSLTEKDKEDIIVKYLQLEEPNLNYINLVKMSKDSDLKLSTKTRLLAKRKERELSDKLFKNGTSWRNGVQVSLKEDQQEPVLYSNNDDGILEVSYSLNLFDSIKTDIGYFYTFSTLFQYTDDTGLITLVTKNKQLDTMEAIFMKSKNEYPTGAVFNRKEILSNIQLFILDHYLAEKENSIEDVISSFFENYLNQYFTEDKLRFRFPSKDSTYLEKIRVLAPEFEQLLKQYKLFVEDGKIDFELLQFDSSPLRHGDIRSLVNKKYAYVTGEEINRLSHYFFSSYSMLHYIEEPYDKYNNLYELLVKDNITIDRFDISQINIVNKLINDEYLHIDEQGYIKVYDDISLFIIKQFGDNEVINYWAYHESVRDIIDKMVEKGLLSYKSTLFTKSELSYFNYYLNKKEFTNGFDLRNKYLHGTNTDSEKRHKHDYYILLKLLILALLKIENDISMRFQQDNIRL